MSDITDALEAMRAVLQTVDPSPSKTPLDDNVWVYPTDNEKIRFTQYPFIIVSQHIFRVNRLQNLSIGGGRYTHRWTMQIDVMIEAGDVTDATKQAELENAQHNWPKALADKLFQHGNLSLSGKVDEVGPDIDYVIANIPWKDRKDSWGIRMIVPIRTTFCTT